jgi:hypothetical protein
MRSGRPALVAGLLLCLAGCASIEKQQRLARYTEPIRQLGWRGGRLAWDGLVIGMSFHEAELVLGQRLTPLAKAPVDELCGFRAVEAVAGRQRLQLEFEQKGEKARLKAIWLRLQNPAGEESTADIAETLKARFPDLVYLPSPHQPDLAESLNPRPLYRAPNGALFFIAPKLGLYFGEICVD